MTIGPDLAVDPAQAYLDAGAQAYEDPEAAHDRVGVVVAAGLLTTFALMAAALRTEPAPVTEKAARALLEKVWRKVAPTWLQVAVPALRYAIELGRTTGMESADLAAIADAYAESLGEYAHETSADALLSGFKAQVNAGWNADLAWRRAAMGYGLDERGMRQFITPLLVRPTSYSAADIPDASTMLLAKLLNMRARSIAGNESYHVSQLGRALTWQYQAATGLIPADAQKRWVTADDEMVCPVCGPLHNVVVPLDAMFETGEYRLVCPGVHPNCRCRVELTYAVLSKAWDETKVKRDREGQFSRTEQRVRTADPAQAAEAAQIAEMLREAAERYDAPMQRESTTMRRSGMTRQSTMARETMMTRTPAMQRETTMTRTPMSRTMTKDTPFGAMVRAKSKTRRITEIYWLPDEKGRPTKVEEEKDVAFESPTAEFEDTVVLNGGEYFQAVVNHLATQQGRDRLGAMNWDIPEQHPLINLQVGSVVDIDATALGAATPDGGWAPPALQGQVDDEGQSGLSWIGEMANWNAFKNDQHSKMANGEFDQLHEYVAESASSLLSERSHRSAYGTGPRNAFNDPALEFLSNDDIERVAMVARAGGATIPLDWSTATPETKRVYIFDELDSEMLKPYGETKGWSNAVEEVLTDVMSGHESQYFAASMLMDYVATAVEPDLFVFHGHFGPQPGILEGQYQVTKVEIHNLDSNQRAHLREEISDRDLTLNDEFKSVRVFHLEPVLPPWVPQTPEDFARRGPIFEG